MRYGFAGAVSLFVLTLVACSGGQTYDDGSDPVDSKPIKPREEPDAGPEPSPSTSSLGAPDVAPPAPPPSGPGMPAPTSDPGGAARSCQAILSDAETKFRTLQQAVDTSCTLDDECTVTLEPSVSCVPDLGCARMVSMTNDSQAEISAGLDTLRAEECTEAGAQQCPVSINLIQCFEDTTPYEARCMQNTCALCVFPEPNATMPWSGRFAGTVGLTQVLNGEMKNQDIEVELSFDQYSLPLDQLPALGYVGNGWAAYASGGGDTLDLIPLYEQRALGTAWAYNANEADGSANELTFDKSCVELSPMLWQYEVTYAVTDLVDYTTYGYTSPEARVLTMYASESYNIDSEGRLVVSARSTAADPSEASFFVDGVLTRVE